MAKPYVSESRLRQVLADLTASVCVACDNAEERRTTVVLSMKDYRDICGFLAQLDKLPEPSPLTASDAGAKVRYWLRNADPQPNTNAIPRSQGGDGGPDAKPGPDDWQ